MDTNIAYTIIRSAMADPVFLQALSANPDEIIKQNGITNTNDIQELKQLLSLLIAGAQQSIEAQQFLHDQQKSTSETADAFKAGLRTTVEQIDKGFRSTMQMYTVAFYLGVLLVLASLYIAIVDGVSLLSVIFGGLGVLDFLGFFFTKPAQNLQGSRADLAQLQAAYYNWFLDVYNWNSYLAHLAQTQQIEFDKVREVSELLMTNTDKTMALIEKYCGLEKP
ncbi:MAG: hypothetical protein PVG66_07560 [Chromatiales bacterium]|jgi:hypothetical protein